MQSNRPDPASPGTTASPAAEHASLTWVPIHPLSPRHRGEILAHLVALDNRDRYLRFGYPASDEQIARYVDSLRFGGDEVFGIFDRQLALIAMAHLAFVDPAGVDGAGAEFGVSVLASARGQGHGASLFRHAMLHSRNRGVDTLMIHALSENATMLHIARQAGAAVQRNGSEADAFVRLPPDTLASQTEQWLGDGAARIDYRVKQQAQRVDALLDAIGAVKTMLGKSGPAATE